MQDSCQTSRKGDGHALIASVTAHASPHLTCARLILIAGLALAIPTVASASSSAQASQTYYQSLSADAVFRSSDTSGCIADEVAVVPINGSVQTSGPPMRSSRLIFVANRLDLCRSQTLFMVFEWLTPLAESDFQISNDLRTASLQTTLNAFEYVSQANVTIQFDLRWQGQTGVFVFSNDRFHVTAPGGSVFIDNSRGRDRAGVASGTVSSSPRARLRRTRPPLEPRAPAR